MMYHLILFFQTIQVSINDCDGIPVHLYGLKKDTGSLNTLSHWQCDQMATLFVQYLAIYNNEN